MNARIAPGTIKGSLDLPPSKSLTQRAFAAALLHKGTSRIYNYGTSDDETAALNIIQQLGASIRREAHYLIVESTGIAPLSSVIDCGESGLAARLFTPIAALYDRPLTITGRGGLLNRPMDFFKNYLPQLGVSVTQPTDCFPVTIKGPLQPEPIIIDGSASSQFLTGLLFAYAFTADKEVTIEVTRLASKPYIDLTLEVLTWYGKTVRHEDYKRFTIIPGKGAANSIDMKIEADWSSAGYWIVAGLTRGKITLQGLDPHSLQADKAILKVAEQCGGTVIWNGTNLTITAASRLTAFHIDATDCPDLFPILAILASRCSGTSTISGLHRLVHKESNRKESICVMLERFGVMHRVEDDVLTIEGREVLKAATIPSFNDHRIAMAAAIGALSSEGTVTIGQAACVSKSYPDFFLHLQQLGIGTILEL